MKGTRRIICIMLVAIMCFMLVGCSQSKKLIKEAEELFESEYYEDAAEMANTVLAEFPDSDEAEDAKRLLNKIGEVYMDEAKDAYKDGDTEDALELAETVAADFANTEAAEEAKELCADINEENIMALMAEGDYVGAQEYLDGAEHLKDKEALQAVIKNETFIMYAILQVKPIMKNPNSLQLAQVEFYAPASGYSESDPYPQIFIAHSGQNGFGGYNTSYSIFASEDIDRMGSTSELDPDDLDYDEIMEKLTAVLINAVRKREQEEVSFDINRLNAHLSNNVTVNLDITKYAKTVTEETQEM